MTFTFDAHYQAVEFADSLRRRGIGYKRDGNAVRVPEERTADAAALLIEACSS
jgi:hypothetical protein